jgi:hypothetical protein
LRTRVIKWLLIISILLNVLFVLLWSWNMLNTPSNRLGRLEKGIRVGYFATDSVLFTLPKGLTVRDVSPVGLNAIGQFENNRFEIIITTELESLINYTLSQDSLDIFDNYYSADVLKYKN